VQFYITLTTKCNLECRYCYGKLCDDFGTTFENFAVDYDLPSDIQYPVSALQQFLKQDPDLTVIFYGGEPLLRIDVMKELMDTINARYIIQTNGLLLDQIEPEYLNRFHTILISIDGDEKLTDYYRGNGVYQKIMQNIHLLYAHNFQGELIARMTVMDQTEINKQAWYLLFNDDHPFSSVHWQLDALFWKNDFNKTRFTRWVTGTYNPQITQLIEKWVTYVEDKAQVPRIYPFVGLIYSMLTSESSQLRCGAGCTVYNIQTNGKISPCPVMAGMKDFYIGDIWHNTPFTLKNVSPGNPCVTCSLNSLCGGRCLYANITQLWGIEGFKLVCQTIQHLITTLQQHLPRITQLIEKKVISTSDFMYPQFNSCEIIP
jgi:putative peptide-modifying radical SAM enzyme